MFRYITRKKKEYLIQYFTYCNNRHSVEFVISDMYEPYLLVTKIMFPKAKYVVDRFHYITYIMDDLDKIRIKIKKYDVQNVIGLLQVCMGRISQYGANI